MNKLEPDVLAAVLEAYTGEGVAQWLTNWFLADPAGIARMEAGVKAAWSGQWPDEWKPEPMAEHDRSVRNVAFQEAANIAFKRKSGYETGIDLIAHAASESSDSSSTGGQL